MHTCPTRRLLVAAASKQTEGVRWYILNKALEGTLSKYKATHVSIGMYTSGAVQIGITPWGGYTPTAADTLLSNQIISYWANMAGTGNPNGGSLPTWPDILESGTSTVQWLDAPVQTVPNFKTSECGFWDGLFGF